MSRAPERIVLGVDGSDYARHATVWACDLAVALEAEVVVVHAVGLLEEPDLDSIRAQLEGPWIAPFAEAGVAHRAMVEHGPPASVLPRVAAEVAADLIVLGTRGTGGSPALLLGSTSHQVAQIAPVPVVIVPPGDGGS